MPANRPIQQNWPVATISVPAIRTTNMAHSSGQHAPLNRHHHASPPDVPEVERILKVQRQLEGLGSRFQGTVCGVQGLRDITWWSRTDAASVQSGQLICVNDGNPHRPRVVVEGFFPVARVTPLLAVDPDVNLLNTVPQSWMPEFDSAQGDTWVDGFHRLWGQLSRPMRAWFNALFWHHPKRLYRFLTSPASMKHHHARKHGLFIHSVDCMLRALRSSQHDPLVNTEVLLMAALLHDLGKADEYLWNERSSKFKLSDRGALIGHKLTTLEWMAAARVVLAVEDAPDEARVMAVYHAINACHAPDWVGLRVPRTPEAFYLASVDGLSGHCDLIATHARPDRIQGLYHPTFRGGAYLIGQSQVRLA